LTIRFLIPALVLAGVSGCSPNYSPDTYASTAAQKENKVDQGVIVGVRPVGVSADATIGTVTGAAAGGLAGSQVGIGSVSAFSALGGSVMGGLAGSTVEHMAGDTRAYEYIVRKTAGDLVSVTQQDKAPLTLGEKVLVIAGNQARVVPDYTMAMPSPPAKTAKADAKPGDSQAADAKSGDAKPGDAATAPTTPAAATPGTTTPAVPTPATTQANAPTSLSPAIPVETKPATPATSEVKPAEAGETKPAIVLPGVIPTAPASPAVVPTP
jgi:outer membrane lipoprotein SlyB